MLLGFVIITAIFLLLMLCLHEFVHGAACELLGVKIYGIRILWFYWGTVINFSSLGSVTHASTTKRNQIIISLAPVILPFVFMVATLNPFMLIGLLFSVRDIISVIGLLREE